MPPTKHASDNLTRLKKRVKSSTAHSTVSQPIAVDSQLSPRRALVEASQASTFESQLRESRPEDAIVALTEGSERVTAASSAAALDNKTFGERIAEVVIKTLQDFKITSQSIGYFVLNNAPNNDSTVAILAQEYGFNATHRRLRCGPHTLNLIGQTLLWGKGSAALFDNDVQELTDEHDFIEEWRRVGPLGVLLSIMNYIKTPQQHKLFEDFQRLAYTKLPSSASADDRKILEPVKPVVTRWNSYYSCFERAVKLQFAVNAYATHHIQRVQREDTFAQIITEYMDILKPLKTATKRLEGRGKSGSFGAIAKIIPIFEYLLTYYEQRVNAYKAVNYNEHDKSPEDHITINLRAAWQKADDYYSKLDDSPAYYAATILHPMYNNASFQALWAQYNTSPRAVRPSAVIPSDIDDAIDSILNPSTASSLTDDEDEFKRWKRSEPAAKRGTERADNPIKYWVSMRDCYPSLSKLALDVLSIPASSCECERLFSELGDLLEPRRRRLGPQLLAAIQCVRRWQRAGLGGDDEVVEEEAANDDNMELLCGLATWDDETQH
ncbi:Dimer-Tnp-hAT dimerization containing protein [Pyrenophora tritici-repentis]|nr:Dimer-Tnp-hAT dimerization containing protein [Pyrenophora tritici-repentis]